MDGPGVRALRPQAAHVGGGEGGEVARVEETHRHVEERPERHDGERAAHHAQLRDPRSRSLYDRRERERPGDEQHRERPLHEEPEPCGDVRHERRAPGRRSLEPGEAAEHPDGHAGRERHVEVPVAREAEPPRARRRHQARAEPRRDPPARQREGVEREDRDQRRERAHRARRRLADAEGAVGECDQPVVARGLLAVGLEVERGQEEAAEAVPGRHLACDLGVPRLVGVEERVAAEVLEEERAGDQRQQGRAAHGARRRPHHLWTCRRGR